MIFVIIVSIYFMTIVLLSPVCQRFPPKSEISG